jgi:hypothetical protein
VTAAEAFRILGVSLPCSAVEATKAFRKRAFETHPDHGGSSEAFRRVSEAVKVAIWAIESAVANEPESDLSFDYASGLMSWREIARRQMTTRPVEGGAEVSIALTPDQTAQLMRNPRAGGEALGQVLQEGMGAFLRANPRKRLRR